MKILINTPSLKMLGGVANHYLGLKSQWNENVKYNTVGNRSYLPGMGVFWLPLDIMKFICYIIFWRPNAILLNPSLSKNAINRDFLFLKIAKLFRKKCILFIHGFDKNSINSIGINKLAINLNRSAGIIVLANEFEQIICSWGVTVPIHLSTTKVDDKLIKGFDINSRQGKISSILFLSRITKTKGIFISLDAFKICQKQYQDLQLRIVGDGTALEEAKIYCTDNKIRNVKFLGALTGKDLIQEFKKGDLYLFPTSHNEGMPTSVLEAMAFGMPVITRPVGGLNDFFTDDMGRLINSFEGCDFASAIEEYLLNPKLCKETSIYNNNYAISNFLASCVVKNLETIIRNNE